MKELNEIQSKLKEMKNNKEQQKQFLETLKNEKGMLSEKNRALAEKLKEATYAYSEAGTKLTEFVDSQIKPIKNKLDNFDSNLTEIRGHQKALMNGLGRIDDFEKVVGAIKAGVFTLEKNQAQFESNIKEMSKYDDELLKRIVTIESGKEDSESVNKKLGETHRGLAESIKGMKAFLEEMRKSNNDDISKMKTEVGKAIGLIQSDVEKKDTKNERYIGKLISNIQLGLDEKLKDMTSSYERRAKEIEGRITDMGGEFGKVIEGVKKERNAHDEKNIQHLDAIRRALEKELKVNNKELADDFSKKMFSVQGDLNITKKVIENLSGIMEKKIDESDKARKDDVDKVVKEFLVVKGQAEESLKQIGKEIERFAERGEEIKKEIVNDTLKEVDKWLKMNEKGSLDFENRVKKTIEIMRNEIERGKTSSDKSIEDSFEKMKVDFSEKIEEARQSIGKRVLMIANGVEKDMTKTNKMLEGFRKELSEEEIVKGKDLQEAFGRIKDNIRERFDEMKTEEEEKMDDFGKQIDMIAGNLSGLTVSIDKRIEKGEIERRNDVDKVVKEFLVVKGQAEESLKQIGKEIERFEKKGEKIKNDIVKSVINQFDDKVGEMVFKVDSKLSSVDKKMESADKIVDVEIEKFERKFDDKMGESDDKLDDKIKTLKSELDVEKKGLGKISGLIEKRVLKSEEKQKEEFGEMMEEIEKAKAGVNDRVKILDGEIEKFMKLRSSVVEEVHAMLAPIRKEIEKGLNNQMKNFENKIERMEHGIDQKMENLNVKMQKLSKELSVSEEEQAGMEELLKKLSE